MERPDHRSLRQPNDRALRHRGGGRHAHGLAGQAALAEEVSGPEERGDGLLALRGEDRQLELPPLDEEHGVGGVTLREDRVALLKLAGRLSGGNRSHQGLGV